MKKNLFVGLIAMTALTVTSCTNDEVVEAIPQKQAIEFGTYLGRDAQARGVVTDDGFTQFGVFAFYTNGTPWSSAKSTATPNFMYNQAVNNSGSAWEYTPKKYWPTTQGDKITFFAYAPMASNNGISITGNTATGTPIVTYTIDPTNLHNMADFVADALIDEKRTCLNNDTDLDDDDMEVTQFVLNHELTRVHIQANLSDNTYVAENDADKTIVNITDIKFTGDGFAISGKYTFAQADGELGVWDYQPTTTPVSIFNKDAESANFVNWTVPTTFGTYKTKGVAVSTTRLVSLFKEHEYLFLIPPAELNGINDNCKISMHVYYDIVTYDEALNGKHSITSAEKVIELPNGLLAKGTAYNLTLTFGMNEIKLSATVSNDWNTPHSPEQDVDWTDTDANQTGSTPTPPSAGGDPC